ncbi:MAG: M81 family metallopeptidase [Gammaproteobacteria bacterium]|nr:M81 family metallopeptidase [Gammaproteobacteria bacterium]PHS09111.1 MAG: microcystin LR degradation protein MlrC-like protein [Acidithiobacillus sp.]RTZ62376.1 MAG: microcystin LR degradation protein MlrC-like protein [Gammaproteobacteria bacterium]HIB81007.1 M81 family peptidase [Gammaproteobacteria bacterium]HIC21296.1 M81 family peptidase [Gammaproteobacteria bacterium]
MKVFIACLGTETNTFSNMPTGLINFQETMLYHGDATRDSTALFAMPLIIWREKAEAVGAEVVESLAAFAQPAGPTMRTVYEDFRSEILTDLATAMPVDLVLLCLHGAMVADGYDDCEGDLTQRVRQIVGPDTVIGVELDLHCSITQTLTDHADVIITFKEYPHIDPPDRAHELFDVCWQTLQGEVKPVMNLHDLQMISMWRTPVEPAASIVREMHELETRDTVLSVSHAHGFPWGDVPDASAKLLVVTDNDIETGRKIASDLAETIWSLRDETHPTGLSIDEAFDTALASESGPIIMADHADNAGVGAPSDSTYILQAILDKNVENVASGFYWDPVAVRFCVEAGEGTEFTLRIGGKVGKGSGQPVDLPITVRKIVSNAEQSFGQAKQTMGCGVWVSAANNLDIFLNSIRTQTFHPDAFEQFGLKLSDKKIVVVKSTQHFYAGFAPIAESVLYVSAPGSINMNFSEIGFKKFTDPYWPKVADPRSA